MEKERNRTHLSVSEHRLVLRTQKLESGGDTGARATRHQGHPPRVPGGTGRFGRWHENLQTGCTGSLSSANLEMLSSTNGYGGRADATAAQKVLKPCIGSAFQHLPARAHRNGRAGTCACCPPATAGCARTPLSGEDFTQILPRRSTAGRASSPSLQRQLPLSNSGCAQGCWASGTLRYVTPATCLAQKGGV